MTLLGPPYTPPTPLPAVVIGRARNLTLQIRNNDGTPATGIYTTATTLAATIWAGDKTTAIAMPSVVWPGGSTGATAGTPQVQLLPSDTSTAFAGEFFLEVTGTTSGTIQSLIYVSLPLVDAAAMSTGNPIDLVTMAQVQAALANVFPADQSFIATLITAGSLAVQRYVRRWLNLSTYIEILQPQPGQWDKGEPDLMILSAYPVVGAPILKCGFTNAIQIQNTSPLVQEAYIGFTTSGDPQISLTNTGLSLTSINSGTATVSPITWTTASPYTTLNSVVASINALSALGWTATLQQPSLGGFGAYGLYGSTAVANAASPSSVMISIFRSPLGFAGVEYDTGCVWLSAGSGYGGAGSGFGATSQNDYFFGGDSGYGTDYRPPVLCQYQGGFSTIPADVQMATCDVIKAMLQELQTDTRYESEKADGAQVTLALLDRLVMPKAVRKLLSTYRSHRVS